MSEDSIYATRRLDPEEENPQILILRILILRILILRIWSRLRMWVPKGRRSSRLRLCRRRLRSSSPLSRCGHSDAPPLPDVEEVVPPPLPEPDVITITPPVRPDIAPEPAVITLEGPSSLQVVETPEIPSPFDEAEAAASVVEVTPVSLPPVTPAAGLSSAQVVPPSGQPPKKNNTGLIILIVVVAVFLLCCCAVVIGGGVLMVTSDSTTWDSMFLVRDFLPLL